MVGLVVVSHSHALATGVVELAREMAGPEVAIEAAGGMDGPDHGIGTDAVLIMGAIERADGPDGVVVLMDLGSAILSTEMALELLPPEVAGRVTLCPAPLVEGAVAAAVAARLGQSADQVASEARNGLAPKVAQLGGDAPAQEAAPDRDAAGEWTELTLPVDNRLGLHARPAALLVTTLAGIDAQVQVGNATTGAGPAPASSLSAVATLGVLGGHRLLVRARGPQAGAALDALRALADANWGDDDAPPSSAEPTATPVAVEEGLAGLPASPGLALGAVRHLAQREPTVPDRPPGEAAEELAALTAARDAARAELRTVRADVAARAGQAQAAIFDAHVLLLDDEALVRVAQDAVSGGATAPAAWDAAVRSLAGRYEELGDPYLAARAVDVREVGRRVLGHLVGAGPADVAVTGEGVLVARDLGPAETASLDPSVVLAIVTAEGGPTSHSAIIARALGVPAVVGAGSAVLDVAEGTVVVVDGAAGTVMVDPDAAAVDAYRRDRRARDEARAAAVAEAGRPAVTRDGVRVEVAANVARPADADGAVAAGADGVGLFRTEFLFMGRDAAPGEDEQHAAMAGVAAALRGRPVVVRTLDAGADKPVPYLGQRQEANPFLGERGVRLTLARPALMRTQLRAVLRVAAEHPVRVMFPMVATLEEFLRARAMLEQVRTDLAAEGVTMRDDLQVGVMVEVPAVALCAEVLAPHADFFSVGTNDLTQYALAAERGNAAVAGLADPLHPAVLRLIGMACDAADAHGAWVGVCGEAAGDPLATPLLVGLGVRELSMSTTAVPEVKRAVRAIRADEARELAARALRLESAAQVRDLVRADG